MDHTRVHPSSTHFAHLIDLHLWNGAPENRDPDHPVEILVNHGYVVGFCPTRLQPAWSAYRVALADQDVDYDRPHVYYDDLRLSEGHRIGSSTFGRIGDIQLNVGHMTPNEVINRQFGRLAQLETFFMSNMSPQYASLNSGVWLKLERAIRAIEDTPGNDHVWAIVGPIFGDDPPTIERGAARRLPIPDAYFAVLVDPFRWPWDSTSVAAIDCFIIPQTAPRNRRPEGYSTSLDDVERATGLHFFPGWARELPSGLVPAREVPRPRSRLMRALEATRAETPGDNGIEGLLGELEEEAAQLAESRHALTAGQTARLERVQQVASLLRRAHAILFPPPLEHGASASLVTYKIVSDDGGRLKKGGRTACNFWNRFVAPRQPIVIRLGLFTSHSNTIARAYRPFFKDATVYSRVEFNTKYLSRFSAEEVAGTVIHEIGHSLGIGWADWQALFDADTGLFHASAVGKLPSLEDMEVERDGGPGTALSHWDEDRFDKELMTGFQDKGEHVLPVTIDVLSLLGHRVNERLAGGTPLRDLVRDAEKVIFSRQGDARALDLDHFEETEIWETIPHQPS